MAAQIRNVGLERKIDSAVLKIIKSFNGEVPCYRKVEEKVISNTKNTFFQNNSKIISQISQCHFVSP